MQYSIAANIVKLQVFSIKAIAVAANYNKAATVWNSFSNGVSVVITSNNKYLLRQRCKKGAYAPFFCILASRN